MFPIFKRGAAQDRLMTCSVLFGICFLLLGFGIVHHFSTQMSAFRESNEAFFFLLLHLPEEARLKVRGADNKFKTSGD